MALPIRRPDAVKITYAGLLTAIVIVLQSLGNFIRIGNLAISLAQVPIVIGAALFGPLAGAWLGAVFSAMTFMDASVALFWAVSPVGTVVTIMLKGTLAGFCSGVVYKFLKKFNGYVATMVSSIVCPVVNTGIFALGCYLFFMDYIMQEATKVGITAGALLLFGFIGINFVIELVTNIVFAPVVVRFTKLQNHANNSNEKQAIKNTNESE